MVRFAAIICGFISVCYALNFANPRHPLTPESEKKHLRICDVLSPVSAGLWVLSGLPSISIVLSDAAYEGLEALVFYISVVIGSLLGCLLTTSPVLVSWFMTRYCYRKDALKAQGQNQPSE